MRIPRRRHRRRHRHPLEDPREDVGVGVDVGVVECGLKASKNVRIICVTVTLRSRIARLE